MTIITRKSIDQKFNDIVIKYLSSGWTIRTRAMGGHQGEIAKVDVTDGTRVVRILLDLDTVCDKDVPFTGSVTLKVGYSTQPFDSDKIWNSHLDIIESERFYELKRAYSYIGKDGKRHEAEAVYTDRNGILHARKIEKERYSQQALLHGQNLIYFDDEKYRRAVISRVRRCDRCKSVTYKDIRVFKQIERDGRYHYYFEVLKNGLVHEFE